MHHHNLIEVPKKILSTHGKGIKIGICDTWIDTEHSVISNNVVAKSDFRNIKGVSSIHGTHITGTILNTASEAELYVAMITDTSGGKYNRLEDALKWMMQFNIDVLNLSLSYRSNKALIRQYLVDMYKKGCIIVCPSIKGQYPCNYDFTINVGRLYTDDKNADYLAPDFIRSSFPNNKFGNLKGISVSTAYMTGVIACCESYKKGLDITSITAGGYSNLKEIPSPYKTVFK